MALINIWKDKETLDGLLKRLQTVREQAPLRVQLGMDGSNELIIDSDGSSENLFPVLLEQARQNDVGQARLVWLRSEFRDKWSRVNLYLKGNGVAIGLSGVQPIYYFDPLDEKDHYIVVHSQYVYAHLKRMYDGKQ